MAASQCSEVGSGGCEFIPEGAQCVAHKVHGMCFAKDGVMKMFSLSILCGHIRGGQLMIDAVEGTPRCHGIGIEFTVISDEDLKHIATLDCYSFVPGLEGETGGGFRTKGDAPNVTREVIDYVHRIQISSVRRDCHLPTQIHVNPF